jgi:hypothetical protein
LKRVAALLLVAGCGGAQRPAEAPAAIDDDLLALLPSGAEAVLDLDVAQLRGWPGLARLREDLPEAWTQLGRFGIDPLADLDAMAVGFTGLGGEAASAVVVGRGRIDAARLEAALASEGPVERAEYHGSFVSDGAGRALALVTPRAAAFGSKGDVRRVVDVALGNDEGVRKADRAIVGALRRAPGAKRGRPAVLAALLVGDGLRAKLQEAGIAGELVESITLAAAVGDGVDIGVVASAHDAKEGQELSKRVQERLEDLRRQPSLRVLGIAPYVDDVKMGIQNEEVHLGFRLGPKRFDDLVARLERLVKLARGAKS